MERGLLARLYNGDDDGDRTPEDRESLSQSVLTEPRDDDLTIPGIIILSSERWDRAIVVTAESSNSNSKSSAAGCR